MKRNPINRKFKRATKLATIVLTHPWTKQTPDQLMFGRELHGKLPKRIVPTKEVSSDMIRQWDMSEKKRVRRQKDCNWGHSPFETEQS